MSLKTPGSAETAPCMGMEEVEMGGWRWVEGEGGSWGCGRSQGDRDKGHSQTERQQQRAQSGAVLGPYGQSGCARRSRKAWGALRGETGRSQPVNGTREPGLSPWGVQSGWARASSASASHRARLLLRLRAGSALASISGLAGGPAVPCRATPHLHLATAPALCPSPWPWGRVLGPLDNLQWGAASPPSTQHDACTAQQPPAPGRATYNGPGWSRGSPQSR